MIPIDKNNEEIIKEIKKRKLQISELRNQAQDETKKGQYQKAITLLNQAKNLAVYISDGLKTEVMNEFSDNEIWLSINEEIQLLEHSNKKTKM